MRTGLQTLNMPMLGMGSFLSAPGEVGQAIDWALEAGVRMIDTAYMYQNEKEIGDVLNKWIKSGKLKREDLFIVTKLPMPGIRPERVEEYCLESIKNLGLEYVDLYLVHSPIGVERDPETRFIKFYNGKVILVY